MAYLTGDLRRESFIDAAVDVIAEEGLTRATTRRIAERANAPLGAMHYCFRDKDELMQLVLQRGSSMMREMFESVDPAEGVEATIRSSIDAYWKWVRENIGLHLALMELLMWTIRREKRGKKLYATIVDPFGGDLLRDNLRRACASEGVETLVPIDDIARFIIHRFDGMVFEYAASNDTAACQRQVELLAAALRAVALPAG